MGDFVFLCACVCERERERDNLFEYIHFCIHDTSICIVPDVLLMDITIYDNVVVLLTELNHRDAL